VLTDAIRQIGVVAASGIPNVAWRCPQEQQNIQEAPMAKKEKMLEDLFHETLKDIYYAEKKILTAIAGQFDLANSPQLLGSPVAAVLNGSQVPPPGNTIC
jgi:Domain of unknown function (DUF892)